jgi:hypothetical protein
MPANAPQVSYKQGELTIVSRNSTLRDILRAVRDQTGAKFEIPPNANERVVGQMGPGPPRDVLAQLLNGSHFNYVILGSPTDSSKLEQVILTPIPTEVQQNAPQERANTPPAAQPPQAGFAFSQQQSSEEDEDSSDTSTDQTSTQPPVEAPVRTPEQLLQELQHQQEQQQQQQQQQPPQQAPPGTPPERK